MITHNNPSIGTNTIGCERRFILNTTSHKRHHTQQRGGKEVSSTYTELSHQGHLAESCRIVQGTKTSDTAKMLMLIRLIMMVIMLMLMI